MCPGEGAAPSSPQTCPLCHVGSSHGLDAVPLWRLTERARGLQNLEWGVDELIHVVRGTSVLKKDPGAPSELGGSDTHIIAASHARGYLECVP